MDFAGLLGLGQLDVDGVSMLCVFEEAEEVMEGVAVDPAGGGGTRADGGDDPAVGVVGDGDSGPGVVVFAFVRLGATLHCIAFLWIKHSPTRNALSLTR
uniref:Uncharacterized protein n=1 Tax=Lactuca sativa TaxID=4236 RepID=A0A9R1XNU8_LACSA|nr:hypothetical protein LSAT_V11C200094990 [Lactuca sativa]